MEAGTVEHEKKYAGITTDQLHSQNFIGRPNKLSISLLFHDWSQDSLWFVSKIVEGYVYKK